MAWKSLGAVGGGEVAGKYYTAKQCYIKAWDLVKLLYKLDDEEMKETFGEEWWLEAEAP